MSLVQIVPPALQKIAKSQKPDPNLTKNINCLPYEDYKHYFQALKTNSVTKVSTILDGAGTEEKEGLLNGMFDFGTDSFIPQITLARLSRPLFIATVFGSIDVVELLLKEGADLFQKNVTRGNILHSLVSGTFLNPKVQEKSVECYNKLVSLLDEDQIRKLLLQENDDGLRPLEMAANLGCLCLYECMHLTPGVYVTKTLEKGVFKEEWIDITEYESYGPDNRRTKSPTFIFPFVDKVILESPKDMAILQCDWVKLWMDKKLQTDKFVLMGAALFRFIYASLFYLYITKGQHLREATTSEPSATNMTIGYRDCSDEYMYFRGSPIISNMMVSYLIFHSIVSLFTSGLACKNYRQDNVYIFHRKLMGNKEVIMDYRFYMINHIFTNLVYVCGGIMAIFQNHQTHTLVNILVTLTCVSSVWSVLYFIQLLPSIGHFAITIQRMIRILVHFIVVFILTFLPFPHAFYRLLQGPGGCSNQVFSPNVPVTYYNTFTILLNMVDFTQYESMLGKGNYIILLFLHIIYVFILSILLLNFLIALLSSSVAEIHEHKMVVLTIQKLCVISQMERHMMQYACLRSLWKRLQSKHFHVVGDRFYLVRVSLNLD